MIARYAMLFAFGLFLFTGTASAQEGNAQVVCAIQQNGGAANGTFEARLQGRVVVTGRCADAVAVPAGIYDIALKLDGAIDRPEQVQRVTLTAGATQRLTANFTTATLEVRAEASGNRAAARVTVYRGNTVVGTVGAGVSCVISAGTYTIVVRYRSSEQRFENVALAQGQRRAMTARF